MAISRTKFVIIFLVSAFVFQFISNSVLGPQVQLFPLSGDPFPGDASSVAWESTLAKILYPIKLVLLGPLLGLFKLPDPPPPLVLVPFVIYWSAIALVLHFLLSKIIARKKA